jgi:(E)-4-hydroxy-3-methylbut-2-enyl-diphosphate synthase
MIKRDKTATFKVKSLEFGGNSNIYVQSMCNTLTKDVESTVKQILELEQLGCDIIRVSVLDK